MLEITTLFSGSSGNAVLVDNGQDALLIDSGISGKRLAASFSSEELSRLGAILVTHEHMDHVSGLGVAARKFRLPVYATKGTLDALPSSLGALPEAVTVTPGEAFTVGSITVQAFTIPHDAAQPVGYRLKDADSEAAVATDMGYMNRRLLRNLLGCRTVLLESNHDLKMLAEGPYPYYLKERIAGEKGHLSNRTAAISAVLLAEYGTEKLLLGHLSQENNTPAKALSYTTRALTERGVRVGETILVGVARREERTSL